MLDFISFENRGVSIETETRRLDMIFRGGLVGQVAILANTVFFVWLGWPLESHAWLLTWALILSGLNASRFVLSRAWFRNQQNARVFTFDELNRWHNALFLALVGSNVGFGMAGYYAVNSGDHALESLAQMIVYGMSAGALAAYSFSFRCMAAVIICAITPFIVGQLQNSANGYFLLGMLSFSYLVLLLFIARLLNSSAEESLALNTRLGESEGRLRLARDASGAMAWDWNLLTDELKCEGQLASFFGQAAADGGVLRGTMDDYFRFVHPDDLMQLRETLGTTKFDANGELDTEHRMLWPDGSIHDLAIRGRLVGQTNGGTMRMTGFCWDISAKKNGEKLRRERDGLAEANRAKLMFFANASHEIRTPLAAINGFTEALLERELTADVREDLKIILRNGKYLVSVVGDLLDMAKSETDRIYLQKSSFSPTREICDCLLLIEPSLKRKNLALDLKFTSPMPETIESDSTRVRQILLNLLSNAIKFTESGTITIEVSCLASVGELKIICTDTGFGMDRETQSGLFEPFARGRSRDVQKLPGSGLGLALSRSLAQRLGGDLRLLESAPGQGSRFEFVLDTGSLAHVAFGAGQALEARRAEEALAPLAEHACRATKLKGTRILVAEDDADLRELMVRYLEAQGAAVETVDNGQTAVERALRSSFNVVLMDIKMPVMDGYEATLLLREKGYRHPIVALTAHASASDQQMCYDAGCDSYLSKPVNTKQLLDVLSRQLS